MDKQNWPSKCIVTIVPDKVRLNIPIATLNLHLTPVLWFAIPGVLVSLVHPHVDVVDVQDRQVEAGDAVERHEQRNDAMTHF